MLAKTNERMCNLIESKNANVKFISIAILFNAKCVGGEMKFYVIFSAAQLKLKIP